MNLSKLIEMLLVFRESFAIERVVHFLMTDFRSVIDEFILSLRCCWMAETGVGGCVNRY